MVAPYWSNVDIRLQGRIYYRLIEAGRTTEELDVTLLNFVSGFIAAKQSDIAANFSATTMLVAQWRDVPPYPNGDGAEGLLQSEAEFINQVMFELVQCYVLISLNEILLNFFNIMCIHFSTDQLLPRCCGNRWSADICGVHLQPQHARVERPPLCTCSDWGQRRYWNSKQFPTISESSSKWQPRSAYGSKP